MRTALFLSLLLLQTALASDLKADKSGIPLFTVFRVFETEPDTYDAGPNSPPTHHFAADDKHPLLVVHSLSDFFLEADKQGIRVVLNEADSKIMSDAFRTYGIVGISAGETGTIMMSTHPFDGSITFQGPVATYLRSRFHVVPGTNAIKDPSSPN